MRQKIIFTLKRLLLLWQTQGWWHGSMLFLQLQLQKSGTFRVRGYAHPVHLRKEKSDIKVFEQVILESDFSFLEKLVQPQYILDGGANIGLFTVRVKNMFPQAQILSVEPDPENFTQLLKNTQPYSGVNCVAKGLWSKDTLLTVSDEKGLGKWALIVKEDPANGTVKATTIDTLMHEYQLPHIDILKLDIESSEKEIFLQGYETWLPRCRVIMVEIHDWMTPGCGQAVFSAVQASLKHYSYRIFGEYTVIINHDVHHL